MSLSLFPPPSSSTGLPRKTSLRRNRSQRSTPNANGEVNLKGVAFQVVNAPRSNTPKIQPATDIIHHSLFCEPNVTHSRSRTPEPRSTSNPSPLPDASIRRQSATRRSSNPIIHSPSIYSEAHEDRLGPLPVNTHFGSGSPSKRALNMKLRQPKIPANIQPDIANTPTSPINEDDQLSPLPSKIPFKSSPQQSSEYPDSVFPGKSPSSKASSSPASASTTAMRSMFPVYDPTKPLDRQNYYPSPNTVSPTISSPDNVSKIHSPIAKASPKRNDSALGLVDGYEHISAAAHCDMVALWKASRDEYPVAGRKVQFGLYQPSSNSKSMAIGTSPQELIYSLARNHDCDDSGDAPKQFSIKKQCPIALANSSVAKLVLPQWKTDKHGKEVAEPTAIFPHAAALDAIEAIANSSEGHHIAAFDPTAQSQQAAHLAQNAVNEAHRRYSCNLLKKARSRDSLGSVTAAYDLIHPIIGTCTITVTRSLSHQSTSGPRAKISFHHPSATPAAVAADTLNLAFIDFAYAACVLDLPGLLALESHYIIDTVLSTLLAVAVIEDDALVRETTTFAPPPKTPLRAKKQPEFQSSGSKRKSKKKMVRNPLRKEVEEMVPSPSEEELGALAKGTLAVMEVGFKAAAWGVIGGVKVGFKVGEFGVERLGRAVRKV